MPLRVVGQPLGAADVAALGALGPAGEQEDKSVAQLGVVETITGSLMQPQLPEVRAQSFRTAGVAAAQERDAAEDGDSSVGIAEAAEPSVELLRGLNLHWRGHGCRELLGVRAVGRFGVFGDGEFWEGEAL